MMLVHEEWTVCGECEGVPGDEGESPCYRCGGAGVLEYEVPSPPTQYASCPKCAALMARRGRDGEVWCRRCNGYVKPFEHDAVLDNPQILES